MQRQATSSAEPATTPPIVDEVLRSPGQPLEAASRAYFEPRFGHDFSRVRVHTDYHAAQSATEVSALAYTVGSDIVMGAGQYQPQTSSGQRLLAHELTHVVQQGASAVSSYSPLSIDPSSEQEHEAQQSNERSRLVPTVSGFPALQRNPPSTPPTPPAPPTLPAVDPNAIPQTWRVNPPPLSGGQDVYIYRGVEANASTVARSVVRPQDVDAGGFWSRDIAAAHDAVFNAYGRTPTLSGPNAGGVVAVRIPAGVWDQLVNTNSVSERPYGGFSGGMGTTELRVNSADAARAINSQSTTVIPPDPYYDFRPGAVRPPRPRGGGSGGGTSGQPGGTAGGTAGGNPPRSGRASVPPSPEGEIPTQPPSERPTIPAPGPRQPTMPRTPVNTPGTPPRPTVRPPAPAPETPTRPPARTPTPEGEGGTTSRPQPRGMGLGAPAPSPATRLALNMGAHILVNLFNGWMRDSMDRALRETPRPSLQQQDAASFFRAIRTPNSLTILNLLSTNLPQYVQTFQSERQALYWRLFGRYGQVDAMTDVVARRAEMQAMLTDIGTDYDQVFTIIGNARQALGLESQFQERINAADGLRNMLQNGLVIDFLFRQGFSVEDIADLDSNLAYYAVSHRIALQAIHNLQTAADQAVDSDIQVMEQIRTAIARGYFVAPRQAPVPAGSQ